MEIKKIAVIGAGTMGNGIAQVFAAHGYPVVMTDIKDEFVKRGMAAIDKSLSRLVKKELLDEKTKGEILGRITTSTSLKDASSADLVVEAALEDFATKTAIFKELDRLTAKETILATNTSSISITAIGAQTSRPDRFIGMHFMNPVPLMKLVEIIRGLGTSDETSRAIVALSEKLEKVPVEVNDYPGFVSNRVLMPMINEAVFCLMEGVATPEAIDNVMKLGMNHPLGPLALADLIGLDICLNILNVLYCGLGDPKYRPCPLLKKMVDAGYLGRKAGRGFFTYEAG
jgi:3-hydroxybutyryl-CoA dehydrogenase